MASAIASRLTQRTRAAALAIEVHVEEKTRRLSRRRRQLGREAIRMAGGADVGRRAEGVV